MFGCYRAKRPTSGEPVSNKTILVPIEYSSIQAAINAAEHGDTVIVSPGTYRENINFNGKDITLRSENPDDSEIVEATIIEARVPSPVITFMSGETAGAVLEGFTIQNGLGGGAIYIQSSNPVVKGNVIRDSVGDRGRGISCIRGCSATIKNNVIQNNTAELGAGIYCNLSSPTIENNVITNNHAPNGAGLFLWFSSPLILDNTINQNVKIEGMARHSSGGGLFVDHFSMATIKGNIIRGNNPGGIYIDSSSPIVDSNIIIENQAEIGSGLSLYLDASPDIRNNIIADNVSSYGVISVIFSFPKITNNTVISNTTDYRCPGIALTTKSTAVITNTIIWQDGDNICVEQNSEVVVTNSIVMLGWPGEGNISQNPLFEGDGDYHLQSSSPGIDAGIDVGVYSDIDGDTRPQGEGYDIGADEYTSDK